MTLQDRIAVLSQLKEVILTDPDWDRTVRMAVAKNLWFTEASIIESFNAISNDYLEAEKLNQWVKAYEISEGAPKTIGLILAGNIPFVGIHDIISVFVSGHKANIKLSGKDSVLNMFLFQKLKELEPKTEAYFNIVERLENYDAVIATGSNTTGNYFEKYFSHVPSIIRKNRHGVAVITNETSDENIQKLGKDIFSFFGLGCRNVSKIYLPEGTEVAKVFDQLNDFAEVKNHNKYMNNYDYNYALFLMNDKKFYTNDFLIMKPDASISSRIASVHYEYYNDLEVLESHLKACQDEIQCVISEPVFSDLNVLPFGESQSPQLWDYADGVDTMAFLTHGF